MAMCPDQSMSEQELRRNYAGTMYELHKNYAETMYDLCRNYAGTTQELHKIYIGTMLDLHRNYARTMQELCRNYTGTLLTGLLSITYSTYFFIQSRITVRGDTHYPQCTGPSHINQSSRPRPTGMSAGQSVKIIPHWSFSLLK